MGLVLATDALTTAALRESTRGFVAIVEGFEGFERLRFSKLSSISSMLYAVWWIQGAVATDPSQALDSAQLVVVIAVVAIVGVYHGPLERPGVVISSGSGRSNSS